MAILMRSGTFSNLTTQVVSTLWVQLNILESRPLFLRSFGELCNWQESLETHAYSVPLLGQLNFGEAYSDFDPSSKAKIELMDQATEGAKAIPAALIGYTAMKIRKEGVKIPSYANKDFLYLIAGKILSRPLTAYLFSSLPIDFQVGLQVLNALANRQKAVIDAVKTSKKAERK